MLDTKAQVLVPYVIYFICLSHSHSVLFSVLAIIIYDFSPHIHFFLMPLLACILAFFYGPE